MMWLNDGMHGRADKTSRTYTKVDRLTGRTYAVTLRNPRTGKDFDNNQIKNNNRFGALCTGVHAWVKLAKAADADAADKAQYEKFVKALKSQHYYPSVFALIMAKRYATVAADYNSVTIADGEYTKTVEFVFNARPLIDGQDDPEFEGGASNGSSGSSSSSGSNGSNGSSQGGDSTGSSQASGSTGGDNTGGNTGGNGGDNGGGGNTGEGPSE